MVKVTPEEWGAFWKSREHLGREVVSAKPVFWREHSSPCAATVQRDGGPGSRGLQRGRQRPACGFGYYPKNDRKPLQDFKQEGDLIGSSLYKDRFGCPVTNRWKQLWSKNRKKVKA